MLFLNPIWLFAVAALSIPVAIHLWNIKRGKVLKIGSISLFDKAAQKSSRSFKLNDVPLFLMRCLLLMILALLLAGPIWQKHNTATKSKGWLLIPKENIGESYRKFKLLADSLIKVGYEFHYFNEGFTKADLHKIIVDLARKENGSLLRNNNYWNRIAELSQQFQPAIPVYIITPNSAKYFVGDKPTTALNLHWQTYTPNDSLSRWIEQAWFTPDNDIKVIEGNSKPSGTNFTNSIMKSGDRGGSAFEVGTSNGKPTIKLKNSNQAPVAIDTTTQQLAIYPGRNTVDATYLMGALQAIATFSQLKINVKIYNDPAGIPAGQSWVFWLSDKPFDAGLSLKARHIFKYEGGSINNTASWINTNDQYAVDGQDKQIALFKLISTIHKNEALIWHDGFGKPVLSQTKTYKPDTYHFYSRFNPTWNDLVWSDEFPKLIFKLIIDKNGSIENSQYDRRVMDQEQLMPHYEPIVNNNKPTDQIKQQTDLSHYCWFALVVIFMIERWWAHKNKAVLKND
ncbi:MAG: BatA domain-containing protein [Mucilaginibacter sp.]|uniref:BatA domain-containing protein n=1 Tax=Mucilaginibacter sp. TaxID=1882438 RepID=UPI0031A651E2